MLEFKVLNVYFMFFLFMFTFSCNWKNQTQLSKENKAESKTISSELSKESAEESETITYEAIDKVTSGVLDKEGNLWFGTTREGVYRYDGKSFINFSEADGLRNNMVNTIVEDRDGILWFGTANGLCSYDGKIFTHIPIPWDGKNDIWGEMCNPNVVVSLLQDKNGNIWVGTCGGGAYRYDGKTFTNFLIDSDWKQSDSLHHNVIRSMVEDIDGNIWFTSLTHGGVSRYDGENFTHFTAKDGLKDDMVFSSFQDRSGRMWFGSIQTKHGGLYYFDGESFNYFSKEDGLCDNFVTGFFEDKTGKLWLCTGSDVCIYDGKTFTTFKKDNQTVKDISFILEDKNGNLWMGGKYGTLFKYDGEAFTDFTNKKQKETDQSKDEISQSKEPGTNLPEVDSYFSESEAATSSFGPHSITRNIIQDRNGNIWLATWEGIIQYLSLIHI